MTKAQAIDYFWNSFGIKAYDENTVPDKPNFPYITYSVTTDDIGNVVNLSASIWDRSTSWKIISEKVDEISKKIIEMQPPAIALNNGRLYLTKGTPFAQRMSDPDDMIRRIYMNLQAEFLTAY